MTLVQVINMFGHDISIVEATAEECPDLVDCNGCTDDDLGIIYLATGLRGDLRMDTLVHELLHTMGTCSGLSNALQCFLRMNDARYKAIEETIVRLLTPALIVTFRAAGLFK